MLIPILKFCEGLDGNITTSSSKMVVAAPAADFVALVAEDWNSRRQPTREAAEGEGGGKGGGSGNDVPARRWVDTIPSTSPLPRRERSPSSRRSSIPSTRWTNVIFCWAWGSIDFFVCFLCSIWDLKPPNVSFLPDPVGCFVCDGVFLLFWFRFRSYSVRPPCS